MYICVYSIKKNVENVNPIFQNPLLLNFILCGYTKTRLLFIKSSLYTKYDFSLQLFCTLFYCPFYIAIHNQMNTKY